MKAKKIVVINQKGGVGKTTIAVNLSYGLAKRGKNTLLVDLDPQSHSSCIFRKDIQKEDTVSNLFLSKTFDIKDIIFNATCKNNVTTRDNDEIDHLRIIPSSIHLALVAEQVMSATYRESILEKHFEKIIEEHDFIIVDCPPTLGVITLNAIYTADVILIPTNYGRYSLDGISDLFNSIHQIKENMPYKYWIIRNMFDKRNSQTNLYIESQLFKFKNNMFKTIIRKNESINQSQINGDPVFIHNPASNGAWDFGQLVEEFLVNVKD